MFAADETERRRLEAGLAQLAGRRIEVVRYVELSYRGRSEPMWSHSQGFDSLDYGLEIDLDDGATWSFIWEQKGFDEGILAYAGTLQPAQIRADAELAVWDVSQRWRELGPRGIDAVVAVWTRHWFGPAVDAAGEQVAEAGESGLCILTLILASAEGREAVIAFGGDAGDGSYTALSHDISVFFSTERARAARVLLPGDPGAVTS